MFVINCHKIFFLLNDLLYISRVTPVTRKIEQNTPVTSLQSSVARRIPIIVESDISMIDTNITSIPDQQPAAAEVVLPVLEPSVSSTSIAKQIQEAEKTIEEKDGHYFMKVNFRKIIIFLGFDMVKCIHIFSY